MRQIISQIKTKGPISKGVAFMLMAVFFFSLMDSMIKLLSAHYSAVQVSFLRGAASLPFVLLWIFYQADISVLKTNKFKWHVIRGAMSVLFLVGIVTGLRELTIANAYTIFFSAPILVAVLSIFFLNETIGKHRWLAIILGLVGVIVALNPTSGGWLSLGTAACLFGVIGYSFTVIIIKKMSATETTFAMVFYFLISLTIGSGLIALLDWQPLRVEHFGLILGLGITGAVGQYFITEAFKLAPASVIAPLDYSSLIWGALLGYIIWDELPQITVWIGAAIIIASGLYLMYRESLHEKK